MFDYNLAFSRNIGILSEEEQQKLRRTTVAIPGCGGVGGVHAHTLARMGIGHFKIADFDQFEVQNFNRQFGARMSTLNQPKVKVISKDIADINPEAKVTELDGAIDETNIDEFLSGVDVVVDSLDFFAFSARELLYRRTAELKIPVVNAGPLGMSAAVVIFNQHGMRFDQYCNLKADDSEMIRACKILLAIAPALLHRSYMDASKVNIEKHAGPSNVAGVVLCAGIAAVEVVRTLLWPDTVKPAPHFMQFDARKQKFVSRKLWFGNRNPIQRLKIWYFRVFILGRKG